ncbi:E3 ubiquitin-protein ligase NEURL1B-like [Amphiura filiformis]|uniref:E3 ubiquitin-protein ligase NEURL1B-like n=1 Tax=Amphiura filiformis TaxID=82378 RepID=UPI003B20DC56
MKFHNTCHGKHITLSEEATVATRIARFHHGIVFGDHPVAPGERVTFEIRSTTPEYAGALRFGFTNHNPDTIDPQSLPQYVIPDLTKKQGYWASAVNDQRLIKEGVTFSYFYTAENIVKYSIDHVDGQVASDNKLESSVNAREPMWPLIDVYGTTTSVKFVAAPVAAIQCRGVRGNGEFTPSQISLASNWTESDVQEWLKKNKMDDLCDLMESYDGEHLEEMYNQYCEDRRNFEKDMKSDYQMNSRVYLKFTVALGKLFKE